MRQRERGTAVLITMILVVSLLGGGAVLLKMQLSSTRATEVVRTSISASHCAEGGLIAARALVANNYAAWSAGLQSGLSNAEAAFLLSPNVDHDLDDDGVDDFTVILEDNDDEVATQDKAKDNDMQVWVIATCTKYPENKKRVSELVRVNVAGTCYDSQLGGCGGNNNTN